MAHTPGPWLLMRDTVYALDETGTTNRFSCLPQRGWKIDGKSWISAEEIQANAHLIAAAPDLLDALEAFVTEYVELVESGDAGFWDAEKEPKVIAARAAIAKARGAR